MNKRIIKFRAWNNLLNEWATHRDCNPLLAWTTKAKNNKFQLFADDFVVEQFTGLLDKNGKEIYEGDIMRGMFDPEYENFIIAASPNGYFGAKRVTGGSDYADIMVADIVEREVIGNIHENKELLS